MTTEVIARFTGFPDTTPLTVASSDDHGDTPFAAINVSGSSTLTAQGGAALATSAASQTTYWDYLLDGSSPDLSVSFLYFHKQKPTVQNTTIFMARSGNVASSAQLSQVAETLAGKLVALGSGGTTLLTAANPMDDNTWYLVQPQIHINATTGSFALQYRKIGDTSNIESLSTITGVGGTAGGKNTGAANPGIIRFGCTSISLGASLPEWRYKSIWAKNLDLSPLGPLPGPATAGAYIWNGTAYVRHTPYLYTGSAWVNADVS